MPIGGFVVSVLPGDYEDIRTSLMAVEGCDVYDAIQGGASKDDSIVITLETATSSEMEAVVEAIKRIDGVLGVDLAYLNIEDEVGHE